MSFDEYLIRSSFPELSDEEVEKILKRIREGAEMQQIPAGKYTVQVERAGKLIAKSGKAYWQIDYKILTGDYSGRIINILCWNEQSFNNHISAVHRHITLQGLSFEKFDLYFERLDNVKYNRLMPNLRKS